jgi:hypothetical protein
MKLSHTVLLACSIALVSCSDDPTSPGAGSVVSLTYIGAGTTSATSFTAMGSIPSSISSSFGTSSWAAGSAHPTENFVTIGGVNPKSANTWDIVGINIPRKTVGTTSITGNCDIESIDCPAVIMTFNQGISDFVFTHFCTLVTGSVTISAISSEAITGTFSGTGGCVTPAGATSLFSIANGTFNVATTTLLLDDE